MRTGVMRVFAVFLVSLVSALLTLSASAGDEKGEAKKAEERLTASDAIKELLETEDYEVMAGLPKKWSQSLSEDEKKTLVLELLSRIQSLRELKLENRGEEVQEVTIPLRGGEHKTTASVLGQDLLIEGGRCAWALERLLGCDMPSTSPFISVLDEDQKRLALLRCYGRVIKAMSMPQFVEVSKLPLDERLKLAASAKTPTYLFVELAKDSSVKVRRAIAANEDAPLGIISSMMKNDADKTVRELALQNMSKARTLIVEPQ